MRSGRKEEEKEKREKGRDIARNLGLRGWSGAGE